LRGYSDAQRIEWIATLVRAAVSLLCLCAASLGIMVVASNDNGDAATAKPIRWLFAGPGAAAMAADPTASRLLNNAQPFIMRGRALADVPPAWNAVLLASFGNLAAVKDALETGKLGPEIKGVLYDYERWQFTSEDEQRNPAPYVKLAADLVHANNLLFLTAPAVNLVPVISPSEDRTRLDEAYIRLGIAADAARYADVFDIQAQRFETDAERYARFVRQAAAQARSANPKVTVLAGISTEPIGQEVTAEDVLRVVMATRNVVDGYWFNIPRPSAYSPQARQFRPDIAVEVLRRIAEQ
jgi:hypothetical protein